MISMIIMIIIIIIIILMIHMLIIIVVMIITIIMMIMIIMIIMIILIIRMTIMITIVIIVVITKASRSATCPGPGQPSARPTSLEVRSVFKISCLFLRPRPWQFEIGDSTDKYATYLLLGFETLSLKFCDLKL